MSEMAIYWVKSSGYARAMCPDYSLSKVILTIFTALAVSVSGANWITSRRWGDVSHPPPVSMDIFTIERAEGYNK